MSVCPDCYGARSVPSLYENETDHGYARCQTCLGTGSVWGEAKPAYGTESLALFALPDPLGTLDMFGGEL
jgi:uncharacterized paraquat-inducible protein A